MNIGKYVQMYSEDLRLHNYCDKTIQNYCSQVRLFLEGFDDVATKPSEISETQIKKWLLKSSSTALTKQKISAVKLFYGLTGKQPLKFKHISYPRSEQYLPDILSKEEIKTLLSVIKNTKHLSIVYLLYSGGFRVSEIINLKIKDIDSSRMVIIVRQGKGKKDRHVTLAQKTLELLRKYIREYFTDYDSEKYLFKGQFGPQYSAKSIQEFLNKYAKLAGIKKHVHPHLIRHCYASHLLENGMDIGVLQKLLGHSSPKTTQRYIHLSNCHISKLQNPLDNL